MSERQMVYKPDLMDIDEARDEMEYCLSHAAFVERKGDTTTANRFLVLALAAEQSYQRIKREYLDQLYNNEE